MRGLLRIALVNLLVLVAGLALGELALRTFAPLPVPGGVHLDAGGATVPVSQDAVTLRPGITVTHVAPEFRARVTTNALGYRTTANQSADPDLVFLGDSFTFGHGVADDETYVSIACGATGRACQNLGYSGTSTFGQVAVLRHAIARGMRPKTVAATMLAACWFDAAGNDLGDNARHGRPASAAPTRPADPPAVAVPVVAPPEPGTGLLKRIQFMATQLEIGKRALLVLMAPLKRGVYGCSSADEAASVMPATGAALRALAELGRAHGFEIVLFVIHPLQELDGAHRTTEALIRAQLPAGMRAVFTAAHFRPEHYFAYDGHFNVAGQRVMGELAARELKAP